ncbi:MAG: ATP-binding cassette domain-containing protein [Cyclobacteriaceae bacterium]|nr:ATP-binding cassette domain-containing protein [Cyclobacteriaceae bacterium]
MNILTAENINKAYGDFKALSNINLAIPEGSIFGMLGPNGAGKTTLIRIITQIIAADQGSIMINNEPLNFSHIREIGYLPEERGLYKKMKVGEHLLYLAQLKGLSKNEAMEQIKVWFRKFEIAGWWGKKVEDLSKGMQQKIQFIATVIHNPRLIILDEPFSGFDPINVNIIRDEILNLAKAGNTIIFSTHRMESVEELCDHIVLINKSEIILGGSKKSIKEDYKTNTFDVEHKNLIGEIADGFEVKGQEQLEDGFYKTSIKIVNGKSPNELLKSLIDKVEVHSFIEKIPSMNEIFISTVQGGNHE